MENKYSMSAFICNYGESEQSIQLKFEHLCKCLFLKEVQKFDPSITYLHSNPNHPGIETDPVFNKNTKELIGFQAKFFQNKVGYAQIENSVDKTIQNLKISHLDILYLYCNLDVNTQSRSYKRIYEKLSQNKIQIKLICGENIADLAREYKELGYYFFGWQYIKPKSLTEINKFSQDLVSDIVAKNLDIDTHASNRLNFFLENEYTQETLNQMLSDALLGCTSLLDNKNSTGICRDYLLKFESVVRNLERINNHNVKSSFSWYKQISDLCSVEITNINRIVSSLDLSEKGSQEKFLYYTGLLFLPSRLRINPVIQYYISSKVCFIEGDPGVGKTHLLTHLVSKLKINEEPLSLFVLGRTFSNNNSVFEQLKSITNTDYNFSDYLIYLNEYGKERNSLVFLIIDAINESYYLDIWKISGLYKLIHEVEDKNFLKIIVSFRSDYKNLLLSDVVKDKIKSEYISVITHRGLDKNTYSAVGDFFNYYKIDFSSLDYIEDKYSNPLFLRLLCEYLSAVNKKDAIVDLPLTDLFKNILNIKENEIQENLRKINTSIFGDERLLHLFLDEFNSFLVKKKSRKLSYSEIEEFHFFKNSKISQDVFLPALTRNHILTTDNSENAKETNYSFFYDRYTDYSIACNLFKDFVKQEHYDSQVHPFFKLFRFQRLFRYFQRKKLIKYLKRDFSKKISLQSYDFFVRPQVLNFIDMLYTEQLSRDCNKETYFAVEKSICSIKDKNIRKQYLDEYVKSYKWRSNKSIRPEFFFEFCFKNNITLDLFFEVLISCSLKKSSPLNAEFLHSYLSNKTINERDKEWTTYINDYFGSDESRVYQIITSFLNEANLLNNLDRDRTFLLLVLFSWILTSSNRKLRDETSKAMIIVLKHHLDLVIPLLKKFSNVKDPYVIQRLYGIVLGSIIQSGIANKQDICSSISLFVYKNIFAKDIVYEDILLRDNARLIIEYTYSFFKSTFSSEIDLEKVRPPYRSHDIQSNIKEYEVPDYIGALKIKDSMKISTEGALYGDFGRYVFESALYDFDCDKLALKNYSMNIIFNEIGYNKALSDYDCSRSISYYPGQRDKSERIGKKYQWIAFYKTLALASDHFVFKNGGSQNENRRNYEGAWEPYVRDFDPTLVSKDLLKKQSLVDEISKKENSVEFSEKIDPNDKDLPLNLKTITDKLTIQDDKYEWVSLYSFFQKYSGDDEKNKLITCTINGFFIKNTELKQYNKFDKKILLNAIKKADVFAPPSTYTSYLKEYPWSQSCYDLIEACNSGLEVIGCDPKINSILEKFTYSCCYLLWEEEYDFSKGSVESRFLPNKDLFDKCKLSFSDSNCELINGNNEVVSISCSGHSPSFNKLVIRKDILDSYLKANGLSLIFFLHFGENHSEKVISDPAYKDYLGVIEYSPSSKFKNFIIDESELF